MLNVASATPLKIKCTEQGVAEFPELLFGTKPDKSVVFDASDYIQKKAKNLSIQQFFQKYETPLESMKNTLKMNDSEILCITPEGHILIDSNFVYLFICFVEPDFLTFMCDRIHELLADGFCISDTYLLKEAKYRLPLEILQAVKTDENTQ